MKPFDLKAAAEMALEALEDTLALCINYKSVEDADGYVFTEASNVIKQGESAHKALRQALDQLPDTTKMIDSDISMRDYFAAKAMQAMISGYPIWAQSSLAINAYNVADEMIKTRNNHECN